MSHAGWLALLCLTGCAKGAPLTAAAVEQAQERWQAASVTAYRAVIAISGDRIEEGSFTIEVRDGALTSLRRNGQAITTRDPFYTVAGMFEMLRQELRMAEQPQRYWQAAGDARIYQRAHFDERLGYCQRYLRAVTGTQHNIVIEVRELEPLAGRGASPS